MRCPLATGPAYIFADRYLAHTAVMTGDWIDSGATTAAKHYLLRRQPSLHQLYVFDNESVPKFDRSAPCDLLMSFWSTRSQSRYRQNHTQLQQWVKKTVPLYIRS